jgi:hypothetical protein
MELELTDEHLAADHDDAYEAPVTEFAETGSFEPAPIEAAVPQAYEPEPELPEAWSAEPEPTVPALPEEWAVEVETGHAIELAEIDPPRWSSATGSPQRARWPPPHAATRSAPVTRSTKQSAAPTTSRWLPPSSRSISTSCSPIPG